MNLVIKFTLVCMTICSLSACGAGEFFIKRAVNSMQNDVANKLKSYADFNQTQEQKIEVIAHQIDTWVRTKRLPLLYNELEKLASDIEQNSQISNRTWNSTSVLLERPMHLASQGKIVENIATMIFNMSDSQRKQALQKLQEDRNKAIREQQKITLKKQNKKFVKGLKIVFSDLGISRTKTQMTQVKTMLAKRKSHIELDNQARERDYLTFVELINNTQTDRSRFITLFSQAWGRAEQGAKQMKPELWEHNANLARDVLNYLLSDLDQKQRKTAAKKIRGYADLFKDLSKASN